METKKVLGIIFSIIFLGAFAFVLSWGIINFNKVKEGMSGTQLYTNEDLQNAYQDGYDTALKNKGEYDELINGYRDTITTLNDNISQLNSQVNDLTRNNRDYQTQVNNLTAIKTQNENTISSLQATISSNNNMISGLNTQIGTLNSQISDLENEKVVYQNTITSKNDLISNLQGQIDLLQQDSLEYNNTVNGLNNQISALRSRIEVLESDAGNHDNEIANLNNQIQTLETQKQDLQAIIAQNESAVSLLNGQITMLQNEKDNLTIELNNKNAEITMINGQVSSLQSLVSQLQTTNELNLSTIASLNGQIASLNNQVSDLTLQIQNNSSSVTALNDRIRELENSVAYYQNYIAGLESSETAVATFEFNGSVYNIQIVNKGSIVTVTTPISTDYIIFNGWQVDGTSVDLGSYPINENTTFVADITKKYDATFVVDGTIVDNQIIIEDGYATEPLDPLKPDYDFDGWTINNNIVDVNSTKITANTTFVAKFTKLHNVQFIYEGAVIDTQIIRNGDSTRTPLINNTTYKIFNGWKLNSSFVDVSGYTITNDTTFVADITYKYDVVYNVDNKRYNAQIVTAGQYPVLPEVPVKEGYEFDGWTLNGTDIVNPLTLSITSNTIYIAKFTKLYTATFVYEDQTISTQSVRNGNSPINVNVSDTAHSIFNGWKVNGSIVNLSTYKMTADTTFVADITYKFDVVFSNEGVAYSSQIVVDGNNAVVPANPTKSGYEFDGWMLNGEIVNVATTPITSNTTFVAKYTRLYNVTFTSEGESISSQIIRDGNFATAPSIVNTNYKVFIGWKVGDKIVNVSSYRIVENTNFVADITYKYDVIFKVDNVTHNAQIIETNKVATVPEIPSKIGYEFDGWSLDGTNITDVTSIRITQNTTFTAIFTKLYNVKFIDEERVVSSQQIRSGQYASAVSVENTEYKTFNGWLVNGTLVDVSNYRITSDVTFVSDITYRYDVTFIVDGNVYSTQRVTKSSKVSAVANPSKNGYEFDGWTIDGNNVLNLGATLITSNTTFIAKFTKLHNVQFVYGDSVVSSQTVRNGEYATFVSINNSAITFNGWMLNGTIVDITRTAITANTTFVASVQIKEAPLALANFKSQFNQDLREATTSVIFDYYTGNNSYVVNGVNLISGATPVNLDNDAKIQFYRKDNKVYVLSDYTIKIDDCKNMFQYFDALAIIKLNNIDTSNATSMSFMFDETKVTTLDVSKLNTSNVTEMNYMFSDTENLRSLDLSNFDTSKVTTMRGMFSHTGLSSIDLSNFNTSNVTSFDTMFGYSSNFKTLDLSSFNTAKATTLQLMFTSCTSLESINISSFNTSNVTNFSSIFMNCSALKSIDITHFDTTKATSINYIFYGCSSLTSVDVSNVKTSKISDFRGMFASCANLTTIYASEWFDTSKCTNDYNMFNGSRKLVGAIAYDSSKLSIAYASYTKGYFTYKAHR